MKYKYYLQIIIIIFLILPISTSAKADENVEISLYIPGENEQIYDGKLVLISGIWHYLNLTISNNPEEIKIILYKGNTTPSDKNFENYYEWKYFKNNPVQWADLIKYNNYSYINSEKCKKTNNQYSFYLGISNSLPNIPYYRENWTLEIYNNEEKAHIENIFVEVPTSGLANSHGGTIIFSIDPFTEMVSQGSDYFVLKNTGNVPLSISINYPKFSEFMEFTKYTEKISVSEKADYHMQVYSQSWQPQRMSDGGSGSGGIPNEFIIDDYKAMITFQTIIDIAIPVLYVYVGHSQYELVEIKDAGISFQYQRNIAMQEGEIENLQVFISGNGEAILDIWSDEKNVSIQKITTKNGQVNLPLTITSTDTEEYTITVTVEAIRENHIGKIFYNLDTGGNSQTFSTTIEIGPPIPINEQLVNYSTSSMMFVVIGVIIVVIIYIVVSQIKYKRRKH
ncbi:MAG: hypothetical protein JXA91_04770 [Candidatus Thermoplasmatota archaeon]|nr:hypothetical protein [Candidatus Thermoplasmatota archaeon]